jgi:hypothetical protein
MAPVVTAVYLLVVGALALGRYRWAWVLLAIFYGGGIVSWGFDLPRTPWRILNLLVNAATFALLVSSPMRDRLRRPVSFRVRCGRPLRQGRPSWPSRTASR